MLQVSRRFGSLTYQFRTAEGRVCCQGNDIQLLCDSCKAKAWAMIPEDQAAAIGPSAAASAVSGDIARSGR
jgi:hypothetical protein